MTANIKQAIRSGLEHFRAIVPLTGVEWADKHFYLSAESSGIEGKWKTLPYQRALINWICDDDIEEINIMKSARVGYTKMLLIGIGYMVEHKRRNIALWQPTDGDAKDFSDDEVNSMLRDVPIVGALLRCPVGAKSKFNTTEKKSFVGATLDIKGGKSGRNYRRMTKDIAMYDETDGFDVDVDGEGSPFELGDTRIQTSSFPKSIRGSTPRVKGLSLIEAAFDSSPMKFYRYLPCPHCGWLQRLRFANLRWDQGEDSAYFVCEKNGCHIVYADYPKMDEAGRWQTTDGYWYSDNNDLFYGPDDQAIARPKRIGAHIWSAYSYFTTWADTAHKWVEATGEAERGSVSKLKTVVNTRLGETWVERGESVDVSAVNERLEDYNADAIPNGVLIITAGADVQGGRFPRIELEILGHGLEDETWSLDYVVLHGDPEKPDVWNDLDRELQRRFVRADGVNIGIAGAFIDSGYLPTEVYKFTGPKAGRKIFATKGVNTGTICNPGTWQGQKPHRAVLHTVNVDEAKGVVYFRLEKIEKPGPGYCHFPAHYEPSYFQQLTNEEKREKRKAGKLIGYEWVIKNSHIGNEALDCRVYALAALAKINPNMAIRKLETDRIAERIRNGLDAIKPKTGRRIRSNGVA